MGVINQAPRVTQTTKPRDAGLATPTNPDYQHNRNPRPMLVDPLFGTNTVDNEFVPIANLITHLEGSPWTVDYYSLVLGDSDAASGLSTGTSPVEQQYKCYKDYVIKVSSPLDTSYDETSKGVIARGSGIVRYPVIPNVGDLIVAGVGDGRHGIFEIMKSDKQTMFKQAVYEVDYVYRGGTLDHLTALNRKIVQTYHYVENYLQTGKDPLLVPSQYKIYQIASEFYMDMGDIYLTQFLDEESGTLLLPCQNEPFYDHFHVKFVKSVMSIKDHHKLNNVGLKNVSSDPRMRLPCIWDALIKRNKFLMDHIVRRMTTVSASSFPSNPQYNSIKYSTIKSLIYPLEEVLSNSTQTQAPKHYSGVEVSDENNYYPNSSKPFMSPVTESFLGIDSTKVITEPLTLKQKLDFNSDDVWLKGSLTPTSFERTLQPIPHVLEEKEYVFTKAFYDREHPMTLIEFALWGYLLGQPVGYDTLNILINSTQDWGPLEKYYLLPVLFLLLKDNISKV